MRRWKPSQKDKTPLPAPPLAYHEREAAITWGYKAFEWQEESAHRKAQCVAHYLHRLLRESFAAEKAMEKGEKKANQGQSYQDLMKSMGLPG